tara:strand:+ start:550 stop:1251 length:702 start_codon:yes stop_codon:yes gene_type:complete
MALTIKDGTSTTIPVHQITLEEFKIKDLTLSPLNPTQRTTQGKLRGLTKNLQSIGHIQPITVIRDGQNLMVVDGHRRLSALKSLGNKTIQGCLVDSEINYDKIFTALHEDTLKISAVQECERWLKGAKNISERVMRSIQQLGNKLGKRKAKVTIARCVDQNISIISLCDGMSVYLNYVEDTSQKNANKVAYYILNVDSVYHIKHAINQFIPIETIVECINGRKSIPTMSWEEA